MDYMSLSGEVFLREMFQLYLNKSRDVFEFLRSNPSIMDRFKAMVSNKKVSDSKLLSARVFINYYDSYVLLLNMLDVVNNFDNYSVSDRTACFENLNSFNGELRGYKILSDNEKGIIDSIISNYKSSKKIVKKNSYIDMFVDNHNKIFLLFKKIISVYSKYGESGKFYSFLYDELKLKQSDFCMMVNYLKIFFYQSLRSGFNVAGIDVLDKFSFNDIFSLEKIEAKYRHIMDQYTLFFSDSVSSDVSEYKKLFSLFDNINNFLNDNNLEFCVGYVCNDLNISLNEFEDSYQKIFKSYCTLRLKKGVAEVHSDLCKLLDRDFKYCDLRNFYDLMVLYRELAHKSSFLIQYLLSDKEDIDKFVKMIYEVKCSNDVIPSVNRSMVLNKMRFMKDDCDKKKLTKFIIGYKNYYCEEKRILYADRMHVVINDQLSSIDLYASYVKSYLDSEFELLDDYFDACNVDREQFEYSLKVLKKFDHPVYKTYMERTERFRSKRYSELLNNARKVISLIKSGVSSDGKIRAFDLVDYYSYVKLNRRDFLNLIRGKVSNGDYAIASRFLSKYRCDKFMTGNAINELYDTNVSFPSEFDSDGNVISTYTVTNDDKQEVIDRLKNIGVPLTRTTYSILLRRSVMEKISSDNFQKRLIK